MAVCEILRGTSRTRDYIREGEKEGKSLLDAMEDGALEGMQTFDSELQRLIESGELDKETGLSYASNAANLKLKLSMEGSEAGGDGDSGASAGPAPTPNEMDNLIER
jgi:twitching motility protein PilT